MCAFISLSQYFREVPFRHQFPVNISNPYRCKRPLRAASEMRANRTQKAQNTEVCNDIGIWRIYCTDTKKSELGREL